ncbi:hypothetical protein VTO42DRAFT_5663 [Malbranchea cinnamomea]
MSDDVIQLAETVQTASLRSRRSPERTRRRDHHLHRIPSASDAASFDTDIVPLSRTAKTLSKRPPIPDLRFEQSYLASLRCADTWGRIAWITTRDQVLLPLIQGTLWTLALSGLRSWNRGAHVGGRKVGVSLRQLWRKISNWHFSRS